MSWICKFIVFGPVAIANIDFYCFCKKFRWEIKISLTRENKIPSNIILWKARSEFTLWIELLCIMCICVFWIWIWRPFYFSQAETKGHGSAIPHIQPRPGAKLVHMFSIFIFFSSKNGQLAEWINRGCQSSAHIGFDSFCQLILFLIILAKCG